MKRGRRNGDPASDARAIARMYRALGQLRKAEKWDAKADAEERQQWSTRRNPKRTAALRVRMYDGPRARKTDYIGEFSLASVLKQNADWPLDPRGVAALRAGRSFVFGGGASSAMLIVPVRKTRKNMIDTFPTERRPRLRSNAKPRWVKNWRTGRWERR